MPAMPPSAGSPDELSALARLICDSPIFAMSLGSKELFHSNILAWFISRHPAVAEAICGTTAPTVEREKKNTDLLITGDEYIPLVIEN